jgi:hypothetical protein
MVRCGQEQREQIAKALVATEQKTGIILKEDLIYGNDDREKNSSA